MTLLGRSVEHALPLLARGDLSVRETVRELLELTTERRRLDLSDLSPAEQARLVAERATELQPSAEAMQARITEAEAKGRRLIAKFGIDPTGAEVHLGHAVPMLVLSRFQRMGHEVVFIVGDVTAKIGDPSGRSDERPALTDEQIASNLSTYRDQVSPLFDFERAQFRHNGEWLRDLKLPRLMEIVSRVPVSMSLQRDDFRTRLEAGHGLSLAELLYSVVMALDSVEVEADVEVGGLDQFLNMQMCRKVMDISGQAPELVVATALIEGTDGTGAKMSKSRGNYVALASEPGDMFGKLMSIPDRLMVPYFRTLTEWSDSELDVVASRLSDGTLHPMDLKKVLAGDITAAIHGVGAAIAAREEFEARFSRRVFEDVEDLPLVEDPAAPIVDVIRQLGFASSASAVRRTAEGRGLRLVREQDGAQDQAILGADEIRQSFAETIRTHFQDQPGSYFVKLGRRLARIPT